MRDRSEWAFSFVNEDGQSTDVEAYLLRSQSEAQKQWTIRCINELFDRLQLSGHAENTGSILVKLNSDSVPAIRVAMCVADVFEQVLVGIPATADSVSAFREAGFDCESIPCYIPDRRETFLP